MNARSLSRQLSLAFTVATLVMAARSYAQLTPLLSERSIFAQAKIEGVDTRGQGYSTDPDQFGPFVVSSSPWVDELGPCDPPTPPDLCTLTHCDAYAGQNSSIFPQGIQFSGEGSGSWDGESSSLYKFSSICKIRFRIEVPVDYTIQLYAENGDLDPGAVFASLEGPTPDLTLHYTQYGVLQTTGTLGPGEYVLQGQTQTDWRTEQFTSGGAYSCIFFIDPVDTLQGTAGFPFDQTVACGGTATFTIGNPGPPGTLSYQWRRGMTPLTNSGNISGANSPTLTISNACSSDDGYYSVVATVIGSSPLITIPSRFAQLTTVSTATGVDDATPASASLFAPAAPNPFQSETALHYAVPPSTRVMAAVYNASGARVRGLTDAVLSGSGTIAWDGRTQGGERAPAGVYFVHLQAGAVRDTKKVVLLR